MKIKKLRFAFLLLLCAVGFSCQACSPLYVLRAGWEEAGILMRRESIQELVDSEQTDPVVREKLRLVLEARDFTQRIGLNPEQSYTQYSEVDRDVLVWVLNAAPKTSLTPYEWWFPIVGSIPYKGFFEQQDAVDAAKALKKKGYDVSLRPSPAFSTLGWFNDPLLSTLIKFNEVSLVETVVHEILHNTIWVKNNAEFNETLANFVGNKGAELFYKEKGIEQNQNLASDYWAEEIVYAEFLRTLSKELTNLYAKYEGNIDDTSEKVAASELLTKEQILSEREKIFSTAKEKWQQSLKQLRTVRNYNLAENINNAIIISDLIYLTRPDQFEELYQAKGSSLPDFLKVVKQLATEANDSNRDPYALLTDCIVALGAGKDCFSTTAKSH